ncbi:hypothetical protein [Methylovulum psychrotolerans]|jgi:hypothetical protein|uniref:Uncharacterized protein n=1 Tax=Methylovulum psychrotolerans TaxID=1704499 RepID=A0A2S5CHI3_9GAMM|nr:hypothetical protein [Methylovulum psychrotolerans]MBT9099633.1 hypothetical protein [Methylovulum psychrotolerans]POZ50249.1 hypothetical protein AADEFJLK_03998 [Methylovulum psychrotolerans]
MNEEFDLLVDRCAIEAEASDTEELPGIDDDRYPGSFFRIPRPPIPGKTGWSLR